MVEVDKEWIFTELKKATRDLTITTRSELKAVIGDASLDELALDFDNFFSAATPFIQDIDPKGLKLLQDINDQLDQMSGKDNKHLWTENAFLIDRNWIEIRRKAAMAIKHFDWK